MTTEKTVVEIRLTSDFICPWCRIGEKRLENALALLPADIDVNIHWQPFELNPHMQKEGMNREIYRSMKFGSSERSQSLDAGTVEAGKPDGVEFNYDSIERTPNTFAAHKLTHWADKQGRQADIAHRVLRAYFAEGRDIGDQGVLAEIAAEAGLNGEDAWTYLADATTDADTRDLLERTARSGVQGVPQFDIEGQIIGGAQSAEVLFEAIQSAAKEKAAVDVAAG
ncbi:DsbA family oxidoreductase [Ruegeria sp. R13_0]|uniref:DsbA family oxidoreductase n=1 Tax=Ruegeria sp. R13_0 TaxID=2821099 RepID=UPI001ADBDC2D|nr:DsbA family oxidoreductase [Ruegeria sp. R13_0]MBO9436899.1 DsbA family oxidoreductase [Ruegeria sp. R13_0]